MVTLSSREAVAVEEKPLAEEFQCSGELLPRVRIAHRVESIGCTGERGTATSSQRGRGGQVAKLGGQFVHLVQEGDQILEKGDRVAGQDARRTSILFRDVLVQERVKELAMLLIAAQFGLTLMQNPFERFHWVSQVANQALLDHFQVGQSGVHNPLVPARLANLFTYFYRYFSNSEYSSLLNSRPE